MTTNPTEAQMREAFAFLNIRNIRYEPMGALIWADTDKGTMRIADLRGWGHLTGWGAWNLDQETARKVQDAIGYALAKSFAAHQSATEQMKPLVVNAFVQGAKWWEFHKTGSTMWQSDQNLAYEKATEKSQALANIEQQPAPSTQPQITDEELEEAAQKLYELAQWHNDIQGVSLSFISAARDLLLARFPQLEEKK